MPMAKLLAVLGLGLILCAGLSADAFVSTPFFRLGHDSATSGIRPLAGRVSVSSGHARPYRLRMAGQSRLQKPCSELLKVHSLVPFFFLVCKDVGKELVFEG